MRIIVTCMLLVRLAILLAGNLVYGIRFVDCEDYMCNKEWGSRDWNLYVTQLNQLIDNTSNANMTNSTCDIEAYVTTP